MRVLVVEDDQETADYICSSLRKQGHLVDRVKDGKQGFLSSLDNDFDVMVIDRMLPGLARRPPITTEETKLQVGDLEVDLLRQIATRAGEVIQLQPRELRLLCYLMRNSDRVLTRTMLLEAVWDFHFDPNTNVVETQVSRLRQKIDKPFEKQLIHTVRGSGYSLHE